MPLTMWNYVLSYKHKNSFRENWLVLPFQEITFTTEFPDSNFLLPIFLTGGKWDFQVANLLWDFQVANLLLATVNCLLTMKGTSTFYGCSFPHHQSTAYFFFRHTIHSNVNGS